MSPLFRAPRALLVLSLIVAGTQGASADNIPADFLGTWAVNSKACTSSLGIVVNQDGITLNNPGKNDREAFNNLNVCPNCEGGGSGYRGITVWISPNTGNNSTPFTVRFNAHEMKGIAIIEISDLKLASRFPFRSTILMRCNG